MASLSVVSLAGGRFHSLFLAANGNLYSVGGDSSNLGLLGLGDTLNRFFTPLSEFNLFSRVTVTLVSALTSIGAVAVAAGRSHTLVLGTYV